MLIESTAENQEQEALIDPLDPLKSELLIVKVESIGEDHCVKEVSVALDLDSIEEEFNEEWLEVTSNEFEAPIINSWKCKFCGLALENDDEHRTHVAACSYNVADEQVPPGFELCPICAKVMKKKAMKQHVRTLSRHKKY
jgi:hypothetical protein